MMMGGVVVVAAVGAVASGMGVVKVVVMGE